MAMREIVLISDMEPYDELKVIKPFYAYVYVEEDEFRVDFLEANLSSFGSTIDEALFNLKDIISSTFEDLLRHEEGRLSRGLIRQLAVLKSFLRKNY